MNLKNEIKCGKWDLNTLSIFINFFLQILYFFSNTISKTFCKNFKRKFCEEWLSYCKDTYLSTMDNTVQTHKSAV